MTNNLSAVIITKNEELNIRRCLESIKDLVSEIIIIDSQSTDDTVKICKEYGSKVYQIDWEGFGKAKKFGVEKASNNWILSLDSDEEVTPSLFEEISKILVEPKVNVYKIKRRSFFLGKQIKHCGWNNDFPKRLFNKQYGNFNEDLVHESVVIKGERGIINSPLNHFTYPTIDIQIKKMNLYSELGAKKSCADGKTTSLFSAVIFGIFRFVKMYFLQLGFLDGYKGFILSINTAYGVFLKYSKLWTLVNKEKEENVGL